MARTLKEHLLTELSRKTLGSYVSKAGVDTYRKSKKLGSAEAQSNHVGGVLANDTRTWSHREPVEKALGVHFSQRNKLEDKIHGRLRGIERASKRLAKEELDEAFRRIETGESERRTREQAAAGHHIFRALKSAGHAVDVEHHPKGGLNIRSRTEGRPGHNSQIRAMSKHLDNMGIPHRYEESERRHHDRLYVLSNDAHHIGQNLHNLHKVHE